MQMRSLPFAARGRLGWKHVVLAAGAGACLHPAMPAAAALGLGAWLGLAGGNPEPVLTGRASHVLLQLSVVALGAATHLDQIVHAGADGFGVTALTIAATLALGLWLGRLLRVPRDTALLVSGGTAICGGSAIAALAGALRPRTAEVTVSLGTIFVLNAIALVAFPPIGHWFGLTQRQFGWWAALAIHDTSSVVGAGLAFGSTAAALALTIKLARALWIAPLTLGITFVRARRRTTGEMPERGSLHVPWFIAGFVLVAAIITVVPGLTATALAVARGGQRMIVLTLFCIGCGFSRESLWSVGIRPLVLGTTIWLIVASVSLTAIKVGLAG